VGFGPPPVSLPDAVAGSARMVAMPSHTFVRRAIAALAVTGALVTVALPASAHAELVASNPVDGSTVTELATVRLEFSEELLEIGNSITVTDGAGVEHELEVTLAEPTVLEAPVSGIAPGDITVSWRNASVDGHTEEGELHVTLAAPSPNPTPTVTITAPESPSPSAAPSLSPSAEAEPAPGGVSTWMWAILGLVVIGGAGAAIVAATRRPPYED